MARTGRPHKSDTGPLDKRVETRVTDAESEAYKAAAAAEGKKRSDWIRDTLNAAARRFFKKSPDAD